MTRVLVSLALSGLWCGCEAIPAGGSEVAIDVEVRGAVRPGAEWVARVVRADGVVVAAWKGRGEALGPRAEGEGARLRGRAPCDPSLDAQPNRLVLETDGIDAAAGWIEPGAVSLPFACDRAEVQLARALELGRVVVGADAVGLDLGWNRCALTVGEAEVRVDCHGPVALDDPRVRCADVELLGRVAALGSGPLEGALPWAEVALGAEGSSWSVAWSPLLGAPCELALRWGDAGARSGIRPVVSWRLDEAGGFGGLLVDYEADPVFEATLAESRVRRACTPRCELGACGDDGCGRPCCGLSCTDGRCLLPAEPAAGWSARRDGPDVVLEAEVALGRWPTEGVLLGARGQATWQVFAPSTGPLVALRDGVEVRLEGGIEPTAAGPRLRLRLPGEAGALAVVAEGPALRAAEALVVEDERAIDATRSLVIVDVGTPGAGADGLRARAYVPTPLVAVTGEREVAVAGAGATFLTAPEGASELHAAWADEERVGWCRELGLCQALEPASDGPWLVAPGVRGPGEIEAALAGGPGSLAPIAFGDAALVVWSEGTRACLAARGVERLLVAGVDGRALDVTANVVVTRGLGAADDRAEALAGGLGVCARGLGAAVAVAVGGAGVARWRLAPSGAGVLEVDAGPSLVAVWGPGGWVEPGAAVEVFAGGIVESDTRVTLRGVSYSVSLSRAGEVWRGEVPAQISSGLAWLEVERAGQTLRSGAVWVPMRGADGDGDGLPDERDPCPRVAGGGDADGDGLGDACDPDRDGDGWEDAIDRCPELGLARDDQADRDGDDVGDACDAFPDDPAEQADRDGDGLGDRAEAEACGDREVEGDEQCDDGNTIPNDGCEPDCTLPCAAELGAVRAILDARTGRCFFALPGELTRDAALAACEARGGHLPIPDDAIEANHVLRVGGGWLGLDDRVVETRFETLGYEAPPYEVWVGAEPSSSPTGLDGRGPAEDCVAVVPAAGAWEDLDCELTRPVTCERAELACGDGVPARTLGEECDDGGRAPGDGCSADCRFECRPGGVDPDALRRVRRVVRDGVTGHCLLETREPLGWREAERRCEGLGGHLAVLGDAREDALLAGFSAGWIGLHDAAGNGDWRAVTGERVGPDGLDRSQPEAASEACAQRDEDGVWRAARCDLLRPALCEVEAEPCGDGVVQEALGERCDPGYGERFRCGEGCEGTAGAAHLGAKVVVDVVTGHALASLGRSGSAHDARVACEALGGYPWVVDDAAEAALYAAWGGGWLGVSDLREPGSPVDVWGRAPFLPEDGVVLDESSIFERCVRAHGTRLIWGDFDCASLAPIVCEVEGALGAGGFEARPCGDGVVQGALGERCDGPGCGERCAAGCGPGGFGFVDAYTGRCVYVAEAAPWGDAAAVCANEGAAPYVPWSASEDGRLADLGEQAWIGLSDLALEGRFVDAAGAPPGLDYFAPWEPNDGGGVVSDEDCAMMSAHGFWNDAACAVALPVACAAAAPACGDGHVDEGEACDDGDLVRGDGCDCPVACAEELAPAASIRVGERCLWAGPEVPAGEAEAVCEAAGGQPLRIDEPYRVDLAWRLTGGRCGHTRDVSCEGVAPALCERAPEACGDGVVQEALGETCDDGDREGGDGCEADCRLPCGVGEAAVIWGGRCLARLAERLGFEEARARCASLGGELAVPRDAASAERVAELGGRAWIGLVEVDGRWLDRAGASAGYLPWSRGQPADDDGVERCAAVALIGVARWGDAACTEARPVVCDLPFDRGAGR